MAVNFLWTSSPTELTLSNAEIHIWRVSLDLTASQVETLQHTLTEDEFGRAERYYFPRDRRHFIAARGALRTILSRYLNAQPGELRFCYSPYGKPTLGRASGDAVIHFNLSHSDGLALYAVARGREVGIDVERVRPIPDAEAIAERFFSVRENSVFRAVPENKKPEAFFTCWTRKEAFIKARGEGLSFPLDQFDVSVIPGEPARLLNIRNHPQECNRWSLHALAPGPGFVGALAVEGREVELSCWQWTE